MKMATSIANVGWTVGNYCNARCNHCYSWQVRKGQRFLSIEDIDKIIAQLSRLGVKTVNLGGNEPIFTNGPQVGKTKLPYVIQRLHETGIVVGLTTNGVTAAYLWSHHPKVFRLLNDIDFSLDSPFQEEHNQNRGTNLYKTVISNLRLARGAGTDCCIIMCGMNWNLTHRHIDALLQLALDMDCELRINLLKPTAPEHKPLLPTRRQFLEAFAYLTRQSDQIVVGEPILAALMETDSVGCPCGVSSFRIHSMTPDGRVPVSPCVYLHQYKTGDLLTENVLDIISRQQFLMFKSRLELAPPVCRERNCQFLSRCRGGCAARAELVAGDFFAPDPYCPWEEESRDMDSLPEFPVKPMVGHEGIRVHENYLCTWIGKPRHLPNV